MFWYSEDLQDEVRENIREFYNDFSMADEECDELYEKHCSIWESFEELLEYFREDDDNITKEDLIGSRHIFEMSNGEFLLC